MADPTTPSTTMTGEISLATMQQLSDINSRISTLTEIIKKVQAFQVSEAVEAVQLETNRMKEKFIKDIEDLKEASREVSSGFNTALLDIQSTIRDMNSKQFNAISDIRSFVGDMTRATNKEMKDFNEQFQKMLEDGAEKSDEALKKYDQLVTERTGKLKDELNQNLSAAKDTMLSFFLLRFGFCSSSASCALVSASCCWFAHIKSECNASVTQVEQFGKFLPNISRWTAFSLFACSPVGWNTWVCFHLSNSG